MKYMKALLIVAMIAFTYPVMAQADKDAQKNNSRARIENVRGQNALVLKTGRKTTSSNWNSSYSNDIVVAFNNEAKEILDSLISAPWGSAVKMKDLDGYNVDVAKANVNSKVGLMFTSGTKCVAVTKEEYEALKQ